MDLLFTMCSPSNVRDIVDELLNYLEVADFSMREELVLKTAILAERLAPLRTMASIHSYLYILEGREHA